jgi:hypothetical protein
MGEASLNETAAIVSYARMVCPDSSCGIGRVSAGVSVKAVNQNINGISGTGFGSDLGVFWTPSFAERLSVGLNMQNVIAPTIKLLQNTDKYPFTATLGLGYRLFNDSLLLAMDTNKTEGRNYKLHIGGEYTLKQTLHIRLGLDETELTTGFGVTWHGYSIDYAFAYHDAWSEYENLGISHRFGLTARF